MPTFDVPVHELVIKTTELNGCHTERRSKPRATWYTAPDRVYRPDRTFIPITIPVTHRMSTACRNYYLWDQPCCEGCQEPKDVEYADKMKELEK